MKNVVRTLAGVSIMMSVLTVDNTRAGDVDWALGQWIGYIQNWKADKTGRDIGARVLAVSASGPNNAPSITWYAPAANPVSVTAKIANGELAFDHDGATIDLHLDGNAGLAGTYVGPLGKRFGLTLIHAKTITSHDGTWTGMATSDVAKCFPGRVNVTISNGELSGTVHYIPPNPIQGAGKILHVSDVSGVVWPDDIVFFRLKKHEDHGRNSWFHAKIDGNQISANDPGYTEDDCSFRVALSRTSP
jgi:hypothetical protein